MTIRSGETLFQPVIDEQAGGDAPELTAASGSDDHGMADPSEPLGTFVVGLSGADGAAFTPFGTSIPETVPASAPVFFTPNNPQVAPASSESKATDSMAVASNSPATVSNALVPLARPTTSGLPAVNKAAPAETVSPPADPATADPNGLGAPPQETASPAGVDWIDFSATTETPATFLDGEEPVGEVTAGDPGTTTIPSSEIPEESTGSSAGTTGLPPAMMPEESAGSPRLDETPGRPGAQATIDTANVIIKPEATGRPVGANTGVFRISATPEPGEKLEVCYTLAAHDANGSISVDGSVTLTNAASHAIITPGPALAGRSPEILTMILRDQPGLRPARVSATLFLAPIGDRMSDSALFEAHRVGKSPEAFDKLVQRHGPAVTRVCQRIVGNLADAEDVSQFVFLTLAQWQLRFPGTLTGWLRTVAKNASLTFVRSRCRRIRHEREAAKPVLAEPSDSAGVDENLDAAIRRLPATLEEAVRLRYLEGHTQQEAARLVGCPRGTLSRRAAHGIQVLRELLESDQARAG